MTALERPSLRSSALIDSGAPANGSANPSLETLGASDPHSHKTYVAVTIVIALWQGMIGVLVKWSTWPPVTMVWARCVVTVAALWLFTRARKRHAAAPEPPLPLRTEDWTNSRVTTWASGVLLAAHWITLFLGYRFCNVGPVVVALFTFPVMAALVEPWFFEQRPQLMQLVTASVATAGVAAMRSWDGAASTSDPRNTLLGIALGLLSAAFFTARSIIARKQLRGTSAIQIMQDQAGVVTLLLLPSVLLLNGSHWSMSELILVCALGVGFTAVPHTLGVWSMKKLTVATSGVVGSLQTVSTLVLAQVFIGESVSVGVWLGAIAVMIAVALESFAQARLRRVGR